MNPFKPNTQKKYGRKLIYSIKDEFGLIEVVEEDEYRSLHFGTKGKQSELYKSIPHAPSLDYIEAMLCGIIFKQNPASVFFLGLGGGSLPYIIHHHYPTCELTVFEIRPKIYEVAKKYFNFPVSEKINVRFGNGCSYLEKTEKLYDIIFIDGYDHHGLSTAFQKAELGRMIGKQIRSGGMAIINLWYNCWDQIDELIALRQDHTDFTILTKNMSDSGNQIFYVMNQNCLGAAKKTLVKFMQGNCNNIVADFDNFIQEIKAENSNY
mgnify:CR=1 FL=1